MNTATPAWELSKENVLPARRGRKPKDIASAFTTSVKSKEIREKKLAAERTAFESHIKTLTESEAMAEEGDASSSSTLSKRDCLRVWVKYIKWQEKNYPGEGPESTLLPMLERCTTSLSQTDKYRDDVRFLRIWMKYADFEDSRASEIFDYVDNKGFFSNLSLFYIAQAFVAEKNGQYKKAEEFYRVGIARKAKPLDQLQLRLRQFERRMMRKLINSRAAEEEAARAAEAEAQYRENSGANARGRPHAYVNENSAPSTQRNEAILCTLGRNGAPVPRQTLSQRSVAAPVANNGATTFTVFTDAPQGGQSGSSAPTVAWESLAPRDRVSKENAAHLTKFTDGGLDNNKEYGSVTSSEVLLRRAQAEAASRPFTVFQDSSSENKTAARNLGATKKRGLQMRDGEKGGLSVKVVTEKAQIVLQDEKKITEVQDVVTQEEKIVSIDDLFTGKAGGKEKKNLGEEKVPKKKKKRKKKKKKKGVNCFAHLECEMKMSNGVDELCFEELRAAKWIKEKNMNESMDCSLKYEGDGSVDLTGGGLTINTKNVLQDLAGAFGSPGIFHGKEAKGETEPETEVATAEAGFSIYTDVIEKKKEAKESFRIFCDSDQGKEKSDNVKEEPFRIFCDSDQGKEKSDNAKEEPFRIFCDSDQGKEKSNHAAFEKKRRQTMDPSAMFAMLEGVGTSEEEDDDENDKEEVSSTSKEKCQSRRKTIDPDALASFMNGLVEGGDIEGVESESSDEEEKVSSPSFSIYTDVPQNRCREEITAAFSVYSDGGEREITRVQSVKSPFATSIDSVLAPSKSRGVTENKKDFSIAAQTDKTSPRPFGFASDSGRFDDLRNFPKEEVLREDDDGMEESENESRRKSTSPGLELLRSGLSGVSRGRRRRSKGSWSVSTGSSYALELSTSPLRFEEQQVSERKRRETIDPAALAAILNNATSNSMYEGSLYLSSESDS
eukprot:g528.t1